MNDAEMVFTKDELAILIAALDRFIDDQDGVFKIKVKKLLGYLESTQAEMK